MAFHIFSKRNFINTILKSRLVLHSLTLLLFSLISIHGIAQNAPIKLIVLDPGHGHATYLQGRMYAGLDPEVHVYAPAGPDVETYLKSINGMNSRSSNPTKWKMAVYTGTDYLEKMLAEHAIDPQPAAVNKSKLKESKHDEHLH